MALIVGTEYLKNMKLKIYFEHPTYKSYPFNYECLKE